MIAEGSYQKLAVSQVESLRVILQNKQRRQVDVSEAAEVGQTLMTFYEVLAEKHKELGE